MSAGSDGTVPTMSWALSQPFSTSNSKNAEVTPGVRAPAPARSGVTKPRSVDVLREPGSDDRLPVAADLRYPPPGVWRPGVHTRVSDALRLRAVDWVLWGVGAADGRGRQRRGGSRGSLRGPRHRHRLHCPYGRSGLRLAVVRGAARMVARPGSGGGTAAARPRGGPGRLRPGRPRRRPRSAKDGAGPDSPGRSPPRPPARTGRSQ
jgi:hypothetical protein